MLLATDPALKNGSAVFPLQGLPGGCKNTQRHFQPSNCLIPVPKYPRVSEKYPPIFLGHFVQKSPEKQRNVGNKADKTAFSESQTLYFCEKNVIFPAAFRLDLTVFER